MSTSYRIKAGAQHIKKRNAVKANINLRLTMEFDRKFRGSSAVEAMGAMAKYLTEKMIAVYIQQYMDEDGEVITHLEQVNEDGKVVARFELYPGCESCSHADETQLQFNNIICDLGNHCDHCSQYDRRKK